MLCPHFYFLRPVKSVHLIEFAENQVVGRHGHVDGFISQVVQVRVKFDPHMGIEIGVLRHPVHDAAKRVVQPFGKAMVVQTIMIQVDQTYNPPRSGDTRKILYNLKRAVPMVFQEKTNPHKIKRPQVIQGLDGIAMFEAQAGVGILVISVGHALRSNVDANHLSPGTDQIPKRPGCLAGSAPDIGHPHARFDAGPPGLPVHRIDIGFNFQPNDLFIVLHQIVKMRFHAASFMLNFFSFPMSQHWGHIRFTIAGWQSTAMGSAADPGLPGCLYRRHRPPTGLRRARLRLK